MKTDFRVSKKQTVHCFRENTPNNQIELNGIEAIYIVVVVALLFTLSFLIILFFILFYFISFFLPLNFSGMHVCIMHTGSYAPASSGNVLFLSSIINILPVIQVFSDYVFNFQFQFQLLFNFLLFTNEKRRFP